MKKIILVLLVTCLILSACSKDENTENISSTLTQFAQDITQNNNENNGDVDLSAGINYEDVLIEVIGLDYFEDRALMRSDDQEIFGEVCAVFQVGTNNAERFTTEEWLGVSPNKQVYKYDVALDEWSVFRIESAPANDTTSVSVMDCIYALNEVYKEIFSAEYYDSNDMIKKAVYESEDAFNNGDEPAFLLDVAEPIPDGYFDDPTVLDYMPVYNFNSIQEINEHFSLYFTQNFIDHMQWSLDGNFKEFEGTLYLTRGGRGYGASSVDFDLIDDTNMIDNTLLIDTLLFGEPDGKVIVKFAEENGSLKIDSEEFLLMYDLINVSPSLENIEVPDFRALVSKNEMPTASNEFTVSQTQENSYSIKYLGEYYDILPEYITLLKLLGFNIIIDGYEGYYSAQKYEGDYTLTVNAYFMNEENGVTVEIIKQEVVG